MKRGRYRPRNSNLGNFEYDGGVGADALRNALVQMMNDPARTPNPRPLRKPPKWRRPKRLRRMQ